MDVVLTIQKIFGKSVIPRNYTASLFWADKQLFFSEGNGSLSNPLPGDPYLMLKDLLTILTATEFIPTIDTLMEFLAVKNNLGRCIQRTTSMLAQAARTMNFTLTQIMKTKALTGGIMAQVYPSIPIEPAKKPL